MLTIKVVRLDYPLYLYIQELYVVDLRRRIMEVT